MCIVNFSEIRTNMLLRAVHFFFFFFGSKRAQFTRKMNPLARFSPPSFSLLLSLALSCSLALSLSTKRSLQVFLFNNVFERKRSTVSPEVGPKNAPPHSRPPPPLFVPLRLHRGFSVHETPPRRGATLDRRRRVHLSTLLRVVEKRRRVRFQSDAREERETGTRVSFRQRGRRDEKKRGGRGRGRRGGRGEGAFVEDAFVRGKTIAHAVRACSD